MQITDKQYIVDINYHIKHYKMHDLYSNFQKFYDIAKEVLAEDLNKDENLDSYRNSPKMSDVRIIALSLCCEALGIDSENYFWGKLKSDYAALFPDLPHRTNFNRRRKRLSNFIHLLTERLSAKLGEGEDCFIMDSIPIPVCNIAREKRCKICREDYETSPDKGFTASLAKWFYGYKLQLVTTINGVYKSMELTKASIHDLHYLKELKLVNGLSHSTILADRGYLSAPKQMELFEENKILLSTPMRRGQRNYKTYPLIFKKKRKRIETLFSQLCDQMMLKRNYAKSFNGLRTRLICKMAAVAVLQTINQRNQQPINHLKHALAA